MLHQKGGKIGLAHIKFLLRSSNKMAGDCPNSSTAAEKNGIVAQQADYSLAVKGNHPTLYQGLMDFFRGSLV